MFFFKIIIIFDLVNLVEVQFGMAHECAYFTAHLFGIFVNYIQNFPSKQEESEVWILDLMSNLESSQIPLCAVANQGEVISYFEEPYTFKESIKSNKFCGIVLVLGAF